MEITVNNAGKSYLVDNGVNKKAFKFDNQGGGTQRTFRISSMNLDIENMLYQFIFKELDTDEVGGYDSPQLGNVGASGTIDPSWIAAGKLDLKLIKINAINKLFLSKLEIEPLNDSGTVKAEFI